MIIIFIVNNVLFQVFLLTKNNIIIIGFKILQQGMDVAIVEIEML